MRFINPLNSYFNLTFYNNIYQVYKVFDIHRFFDKSNKKCDIYAIFTAKCKRLHKL